MKQSSFITKFMMAVLFTGVVLYLAAAAWQSLSDPFTTVIAYGYTLDDAAEVTAYVVRDEMALPSAGIGIVSVVPDEGEKLGAGQTVAVLYKDEEALQRRQTLRSLELNLDQLEYSLQQSDASAQAGELDDTIFSAMVHLRQAAVNHDFSDLDDQTLSLKSLVFRREYTHSGDASTEIEAMIHTVSSQIADLQAAAVSDTSSITTSASGVYSNLVDGYETILTPTALDGLTVSGFRTLTGVPAADPGNAVGKLITSSRWYLMALLPQEEAGRLYENELITVAFTHDFNGEVPMLVESVSKPEDGQAAVVFSATHCLSDITLLRKQTVDVVFSRHSGLRVPKKALRVLEDGTTGVYVVTGATAEFKQVNVAAEGEDYFILTTPEGVSDKHKLSAGDEVIVAAGDLYDGKVVR